MDKLSAVESLPNYARISEELIARHSNDPFVSREELDDLLGERGNVEAFLGTLTYKQGFLLHGSQSRVRSLEPRKAHDTEGAPENELQAVYATDIPATAIYKALVSDKKITEQERSIEWGGGIHAVPKAGLRIPVFNADQPLDEVMDDGYVYVCNAETFVPLNSDPAYNYHFASDKVVQPVLVIPVKPSDFKHKITIQS